MSEILNLDNQKFGKLTVKGFSHIENEKSYFLCECSCESKTKITVRGSDLKSGRQKSCGCSRKEIKRDKKHGMNRTRIYRIWTNMKYRCNNMNDNNYGGRGVSYDESWGDFENFYNDMKDGYSSELTLDRIDNSKGYCKDNCRWVTNKVQSSNRRTNVFVTINNTLKTVHEWTESLGKSKSFFYNIYRRTYGDDKDNYLDKMTKIISEYFQEDIENED